jgi:hypothetical protein
MPLKKSIKKRTVRRKSIRKQSKRRSKRHSKTRSKKKRNPNELTHALDQFIISSLNNIYDEIAELNIIEYKDLLLTHQLTYVRILDAIIADNNLDIHVKSAARSVKNLINQVN